MINWDFISSRDAALVLERQDNQKGTKVVHFWIQGYPLKLSYDVVRVCLLDYYVSYSFVIDHTQIVFVYNAHTYSDTRSKQQIWIWILAPVFIWTHPSECSSCTHPLYSPWIHKLCYVLCLNSFSEPLFLLLQLCGWSLQKGFVESGRLPDLRERVAGDCVVSPEQQTTINILYTHVDWLSCILMYANRWEMIN